MKLKTGRQYTHREAFIIWSRDKSDEWHYWLEDQGFYRCEICKSITDDIDLICELRPADGDIVDEWYVCDNGKCGVKLRDREGIDEDGYPQEVLQ